MKHKIISRLAALAAMALLSTLIETKAEAQPCATCLSLSSAVHQAWCGDLSCYTFVITNNCASCITSITMSDPGNTITSGCCAIVDPTWDAWEETNNSNGSCTVDNGGSGPCIATGESVQVTLCGVSKGDNVTFNWAPSDPPCVANTQTEVLTLP